MTALVRAELLKLRSARITTWLLLASLALVTLTVIASTPTANSESSLSLDDPSLLAVVVGSAFGVPQVLIALYGTTAFTQEFRYGTITQTYLGEPRRTRIFSAKWLALALVSVVVTTATLVLAVPLATALIHYRNGDVTAGAQFWQTIAASFGVMVLYAVIGVALGALIRNQIVAVPALLVWMLAVEWIVVPSYPPVGRWLPLGAASAVMQLESSIGLDGKLLPPVFGGLVLAAYAAGAAALALWAAPQRDVL
jgi:ABC-type transport system involved in multi-copper enzyme maturation permease subunit